ncbi:MAG: tetratricopeptide repeat protein, partial [Candidatus Aminicenantes bacterium]|nr:tetratricopeptide repeat protein [Candidatus Aminicenantes bacterium]
ESHLGYSFLLTITKRNDEAIIEAKRAQELDPLSSIINSNAGTALFYAGRYDEAIEVLKMTITLNPSFFHAHYMLGLAYRDLSMIEEAAAEFEKAVNLSGGYPMILITLASVCYKRGKKARAEKLIERLKEKSQQGYIPPMCFFYLHLRRGELDQASKWLKKACEERDTFLLWIMVSPREKDRILDDPKFNKLLKEAGLIA